MSSIQRASTAGGVKLRFGAALLALAAGAAGAVVAVDLLRSVPGPTGASAGSTAGVSSVPAGRTSILGGRVPTPAEPEFPAPPIGAIVLSREAGSDALALGIVPGSARTLVRVSVLSPSGTGAAGLDVGVRFGRRAPTAMKPCGAGCYQAELAAAAVSGLATVSLDDAAYTFVLPSELHPADGADIVHKAAEAWLALKTVVWHERLAGSPTNVIHTVYKAVAPDELSYTIAGRSAAVIIGGRRWDRSSPAAPWRRGSQNPPLQQPSPFWVAAFDARVLGTGRAAGRGVWFVSFFDPETPAWYEAVIDRHTYRTLELTMVAASHFMHHVYGPFNAPLRLRPP